MISSSREQKEVGGKRELSERNKSNKLRDREIVREIVKKIDDKLEAHIEERGER